MKHLNQCLAVCVLSVWAHSVSAGAEEEAIARGWIEASHTGQEAFSAYIKKHMAEDGVWRPARYVGFGFSMDPTNDKQQIVAMVTPGTPASEVLRVGDIFVSVDGVEATPDNAARLNFRGKPGQAVKAVVSRDGEEIPIEVKRDVISPSAEKAATLKNLALGDPEDWAVDEGEILEIVSAGNVVFVVDEISDTDDDTGAPYVDRSVTRFEFNDTDQVVDVWSIDESRFVLEQQGYTISR